jgi:hypothetical protein
MASTGSQPALEGYGERCHPSQDSLILLTAFGMHLSIDATDEVLMAADYKPLVLASAIR